MLVLELELELALLELSTLSLVQAAQREDAERSSSHGRACATTAGRVGFGVRCGWERAAFEGLESAED